VDSFKNIFALNEGSGDLPGYRTEALINTSAKNIFLFTRLRVSSQVGSQENAATFTTWSSSGTLTQSYMEILSIYGGDAQKLGTTDYSVYVNSSGSAVDPTTNN